MRRFAFLILLSMVAAACGGSNSDPTTTSGGGDTTATTSSTSGATGTTAADAETTTTTSDVGSGAAQFVISRVVFGEGGFVSVTNVGTVAGNLDGWQLCQRPAYYRIDSVEVAPGETVHFTDGTPDGLAGQTFDANRRFGRLQASGGEVGLYADNAFGERLIDSELRRVGLARTRSELGGGGGRDLDRRWLCRVRWRPGPGSSGRCPDQPRRLGDVLALVHPLGLRCRSSDIIRQREGSAMAQPREAEASYESGDRSDGPVVRRSWKLVPGSQGPLLTGLFGFPWRGPILQAKCTATEFGGGVQYGGRVDRRHRRVPSLGCTCGIYACDDPDMGWLLGRMLSDSAIVTGFVRLSGRVVVAGPVYRAEEAEVVGPLTITPPQPGRFRRLGGPVGVSQQVRRVSQDDGRFVFWYSSGRRRIPVVDWHQQMSEALARRYLVEVVELLAPGLMSHS